MNEIIDVLSRNPWLIVVGSVASIIGVIGVPLTIYYYFKSKKERKPRFALRSTAIISDAKSTIPSLTIRFAGYEEPITNLIVTKLAFWNDGNETIRREDVVSEVTVRIKEGAILKAAVIQRTTEENEFTITTHEEKKSAGIVFRYADCDEGALFQILHTGGDISLDGRIMGAGAPIRMFLTKTPQKQSMPFSFKTLRRVLFVVSILLPLFIPVMVISNNLASKKTQSTIFTPTVDAILNILFLCLFGMMFVACWGLAYLIWNIRVPYRLDDFFKDW